MRKLENLCLDLEYHTVKVQNMMYITQKNTFVFTFYKCIYSINYIFSCPSKNVDITTRLILRHQQWVTHSNI